MVWRQARQHRTARSTDCAAQLTASAAGGWRLSRRILCRTVGHATSGQQQRSASQQNSLSPRCHKGVAFPKACWGAGHTICVLSCTDVTFFLKPCRPAPPLQPGRVVDLWRVGAALQMAAAQSAAEAALPAALADDPAALPAALAAAAAAGAPGLIKLRGSWLHALELAACMCSDNLSGKRLRCSWAQACTSASPLSSCSASCGMCLHYPAAATCLHGPTS